MAFPYVVNLCANQDVAEREAGTTYTFGAGTPIRSFLPLDERHRVANFLATMNIYQFFHPAEGGGHYALVSLRMSGPDERQQIRSYFQREGIAMNFDNRFCTSGIRLFLMNNLEWDMLRLKISNENFFKFCQVSHDAMLVIWVAIREIETGGTPPSVFVTPNQSPISSSLSTSAGHSSASGNSHAGSGHSSAVANSNAGSGELPSVEQQPQHEEE